jgi:hypothetical protein
VHRGTVARAHSPHRSVNKRQMGAEAGRTKSGRRTKGSVLCVVGISLAGARGQELGASAAAEVRATTQKLARTDKGSSQKGRRTDRVRPPGVFGTVGLPPAGGGAAQPPPGCGLAGVVVAAKLMSDVPTVPCTHKRTTNTRCGYRSGAAPRVFCPGVLLLTASCCAEEFLAGMFESAIALGACSATTHTKGALCVFHLTK